MRRPEPSPDFFALIEVLNRHGAEYIVVGGVSAVLAGAIALEADLIVRAAVVTLAAVLRVAVGVDASLLALGKSQVLASALRLPAASCVLGEAEAGSLSAGEAAADGYAGISAGCP